MNYQGMEEKVVGNEEVVVNKWEEKKEAMEVEKIK